MSIIQIEERFKYGWNHQIISTLNLCAFSDIYSVLLISHRSCTTFTVPPIFYLLLSWFLIECLRNLVFWKVDFKTRIFQLRGFANTLIAIVTLEYKYLKLCENRWKHLIPIAISDYCSHYYPIGMVQYFGLLAALEARMREKSLRSEGVWMSGI